MKWKQLTKTFIMISIFSKTLGIYMVHIQIFQRAKGYRWPSGADALPSLNQRVSLSIVLYCIVQCMKCMKCITTHVAILYTPNKDACVHN